MRIAVLDDYQGRARGMADWNSLRAERIEFFRETIPAAQLPDKLGGFDVLVLMRERTRFDAQTLKQLPALRFVVTTGMRNAALDVEHLHAAGIPVAGTGVPGYQRDITGTSSTVELAWALILALFKRVASEDRALREGRWQTDLAENLAGRTLGLLGLGRLGTQMVAPAKAFGMEVVAWSQNLEAEQAEQRGARYVAKQELFAGSDVISVHLVLSERSRGLVGAEQLGQMKPSAYLINTSRGPIVDAAALTSALSAGQIAGAGLDVFDTEPLPAGDPILSAPNTVLTPHLGYATEEGLSDMYRQVVEDIAAFAQGEPIRLVR